MSDFFISSNLIKEKKKKRERNEPVWDYSYLKIVGNEIVRGMEDKDRV